MAAAVLKLCVAVVVGIWVLRLTPHMSFSHSAVIIRLSQSDVQM
jgi:hypothetical protein